MKDIVIKGLSKRFGDKVVLEGLDLTLRGGEISCVMGESGCGKSTLIKLIMGLYRADAGKISGVPKKISAVFQEDRLCEDFSALTNVRMVAARGVSAAQIADELSALGLDGNQKTPARELSGGMRRRVALARAMLADSELVILDEPFSGLDPENRAVAIDYVLTRRRGRTVVVVTHDADDATDLGATEVIRL